ncbi:MAG: hypothetical protein ACK5JM_05635 [Rhodoblastus sp.]
MKKIVLIGLATAGVCAASQAFAGTYIVEESRSRYINCYNKVYVPAKVLVNTRGVRVRGESRGWEISGNRWDHVRNPAVYMQTRRTVEPDHYTLQATSCQ